MRCTSPRPFLVIGLVGGVASGKSTVAEMFRRLGAEVIDADRLGHQALEDPKVRRRVVEEFGEGVIGKGGRVDRKLLGAFAFRSEGELERLEEVVHPWVLERMRWKLDRLARRPRPPKLVVLDVVLLLESGADALCDRIIYVKAPRRARTERAVRDRAWDRGEVGRRERYQRSLAAKLRAADEEIDNDGALGETFRQVQEIFQGLVRMSGRGAVRPSRATRGSRSHQ